MRRRILSTIPPGRKRCFFLSLYSGIVVWNAEKGLWLADMIGNVLEWCGDRHGDYPSTLVKNPAGSESGSLRVARGGSLNYSASDCRCAYRDCFTPRARGDVVGFRVVLVPV